MIMLMDEMLKYVDRVWSSTIFLPQGLDMDRMLGLQDAYVQKQFDMTGLELDRATNSSYLDMTRWASDEN